MAQVREVRLVDDLDGSDAVETIPFAYRGRSYEIDLSETHVKAFEESMADFVEAARVVKASGKVAPARRQGGKAVADPEQVRALRDWARANGYDVKDRGRVPQAVVDEYNAAR